MMQFHKPGFLILLLLTPFVIHGQATCPWMNRATASGLMDTPMEAAEVQGTSPNVTCIYNSPQGGDNTRLTIQVAQLTNLEKHFGAFDAMCQSKGERVAAIGNEAVLCAADDQKSRTERVVGRVRDLAFVVTVSSSLRIKTPSPRDKMKMQATRIAEQVAGFLL